MVYVAALVSLVLLVGAVAVIAGMIAPNMARIACALFGYEFAESSPKWAEARVIGQPRVIAIRSLLRAAV